MHLPRKYFVAGLLVVLVAPSAHGVTVTKNRTVDVNSSQLESPYFTESADGVVAPTPTANGWAPATPTKAGAVTSTSPRGVFAIAGNATSAGSWTDGNGIPTGLTLNFNAQYTISVGPNAPAGSFLTFTGNLGNPPDNDFGNGLGMTQTPGGTGPLEGLEELSFSPFTISGVNFSGTMAESGFTLDALSVSPLSSRVFRSAGFTSASEGALLTRTSDNETIGFGTQAGTLASNVPIGNNFSNPFADQAGPFTLVMTAGNMALKGIRFAYGFSYDINSIVTADNADFDSDLDVDGADFLTWQQNFGTETDGLRSQGNANPSVDGAIDAADFAIWQHQFGTAPDGGGALGVPEPSALLLAVGTSIALGIHRRSRRTSRR